MKTLHTYPDGSRLALIPAPEWDGLLAAVELTYDSPDSVPPDMREVGTELWRAFHDGHTRTQQGIIDDTNRAIDAGWPEATHEPGELRVGDAVRLRDEQREEYEATRNAAEAVIRCLPAQVAGFERGSDLSGTLNWHYRDLPVVYATPNWEGEHSTPVNIGDGSVEAEFTTSIPFDATLYVGRAFEGAAEYVRLITPILERVAGSFETLEAERLFPWPTGGSFLGLTVAAGSAHGRALIACPMNADGTPDEDSLCEVQNIEGLDLAEINAFFGTEFKEADFYGR